MRNIVKGFLQLVNIHNFIHFFEFSQLLFKYPHYQQFLLSGLLSKYKKQIHNNMIKKSKK